jgi:hypothetical protein
LSPLKKLKIGLPYQPAIQLLGNIPEGMRVRLQQRHLHTTFIAALFITAKLSKQPRCPTTDEWIKKMWYLYPV